jgi:hypothetical protein
MAKKPKPPLTLVDEQTSASGIQPARELGANGRRLWNQVMAEYDISDCGGLEMLVQACQSLDRAEDLRAQIDADGVVVRTRGVIRDHPALKHELAARAFVVRTLARLGLSLEPIRPAVGRPGLKLGGWEP